MKKFTFIAYCTFGDGDSGDTWIDFELTDEEAAKLVKYGTQPDIYHKGFNKCEELKDIYDKIYDIAVEQITEELLDADWLEAEELDDSDWSADEWYSCVVNFPEEFEKMFADNE